MGTAVCLFDRYLFVITLSRALRVLPFGCLSSNWYWWEIGTETKPLILWLLGPAPHSECDLEIRTCSLLAKGVAIPRKRALTTSKHLPGLSGDSYPGIGGNNLHLWPGLEPLTIFSRGPLSTVVKQTLNQPEHQTCDVAQNDRKMWKDDPLTRGLFFL